MTTANDLRSSVSFFAVVSADDGYGNVTSGYADTPDLTVAANIKPRLGGEAVLAGRLTGHTYVNITVRMSADTRQINEGWKARDARSGTEYNIRSIIDPDQGTDMHGRFLEMLCEEGVAV